jgi:hypothetical protein
MLRRFCYEAPSANDSGYRAHADAGLGRNMDGVARGAFLQQWMTRAESVARSDFDAVTRIRAPNCVAKSKVN